MNALLSRLFPAALLVSTCLVLGCGDKLALVPVSGKVTTDGTPVTAGQISLHNTADVKGEKPVPPSGGTIDSSGNYTVYTGGKPGAPVGKYKVTVNPSMVPTGGTKAPSVPFNQRYQDSKRTTLEIDVTASAAAGAYDLKMTAK